jgi:hypothetical protein
MDHLSARRSSRLALTTPRREGRSGSTAKFATDRHRRRRRNLVLLACGRHGGDSDAAKGEVIHRWEWIALIAAILLAVAITVALSPTSYWHMLFTGYCSSRPNDTDCHCIGLFDCGVGGIRGLPTE